MKSYKSKFLSMMVAIAVLAVLMMSMTSPVMATDYTVAGNAGLYGAAAGQYQTGSYQGDGTAWSSSVTSGGAGSQANSNGNGTSSQHSTNDGGGTAFAGVYVNAAGVTSTTAQQSYSDSKAHGQNTGYATGDSGASGGTDTNAGASGHYSTTGHGAWGEASGFIVVGGFANFGNFSNGNHYGQL